MSFQVGQTVGNYSIQAVLGASSMGPVYKVEHALTGRPEAMKVLSAELASDVHIKRFEREIRLLARLSHPNIATLHNAIHSDSQMILMMEYVEGQTLASLFQAGRLPLAVGTNYVKQVLMAVGYAHQQGIVHRDINPANVMITAEGQVKLTDFGLSKSYGDSLLTNCGDVLGSLPYMAPERIKGSTQPDRRSDLYSVGAILYEHLTGQTPFGGNRSLAAVVTDTEADPTPPSQLEPSLAAGWDEVIASALARDPARRYRSAEEFLSAIARLEEPAVADLPLPRLGTLGMGIGLFAGLILAMVASPSVERVLRPAAMTPGQPFHIAPPPFAKVVPQKPPAISQVAIAEVSRHRPVARPRHLGEPARRNEFSSFAPAAQPAAAVPTAPAAAPSLSAPVIAVTQDPEQAAPLDKAVPDGTAATAAVAPAVNSDETENPPAAVPHKKHFWSKWNVFRSRRSGVRGDPR